MRPDYAILNSQGQLAKLPDKFPEAETLPELSPDRQHLAYKTKGKDEVSVIEIGTGLVKTVSQARQPKWQKGYLMVMKNSGAELIDVKSLFAK